MSNFKRIYQISTNLIVPLSLIKMKIVELC